jgi:hydroxymethylpyrimidine/phosphomethylpyrimidine kinase
MNGRVLIVAGSDSGGGAGIQADIKTVTALNGYAATAITALTAQNTQGVFDVVSVEPAFIQQQMRVVLADIGADCIKIGMLHTSKVIEAVAEVLKEAAPNVPLVVDPVMIAKGGALLLDPTANATLMRYLIPLATVLTPNIPEAEILVGHAVEGAGALELMARELLALGSQAVLLKGGHLSGDVVTDILVWTDGAETYSSPRSDSRHTHGTGCTLASALATGIAQGQPLPQAVRKARAYVQEAIRTAPGFGSGHGPLNHAHTVSLNTR